MSPRLEMLLPRSDEWYRGRVSDASDRVHRCDSCNIDRPDCRHNVDHSNTIFERASGAIGDESV